MSEGENKEREFHCAACGRDFIALPEDVDRAHGHLCIAMDQGLTQREGLEKLREVPSGSK